VFLVGFGFNVVGVALMMWNVASPSTAAAQRYVLALMCALALAGINFIVTVDVLPAEITGWVKYG
jgi:hypothetical protein